MQKLAGYSITVTRTGEKIEPQYNVQPSPAKPVPANIVQAYINLEALLTGGNPFDESEPVTGKTDAEFNPEDVPF